MAVKLYDGAWGVTRKHSWVEAQDRVRGPFKTSTVGLGFRLANPLDWYSDNGIHCSRFMSCEIVAVFATEKEARAYVERKGWWGRLKGWVVRTWDWRMFTLGVLIGTVILILTACSEIPTSPKPTCITEASDGKVYYCDSDSLVNNNAAVGRGGFNDRVQSVF